MATQSNILSSTFEADKPGIELGIGADKGIMALRPDPSSYRYKVIRSAISDEAFRHFRYHDAPRFSIIELALCEEEVAARQQELTAIAENVSGAWLDRWGVPLQIDKHVHILGKATPPLGEVFFTQLGQTAAKPGLALPSLVRPLPA